MRIYFYITFSILFFFLFCKAEVPSFFGRNRFFPASPGAMGVGLYGYDNPALLTYLHQIDGAFFWTDELEKSRGLKEWMLCTALPHLGFCLNQQNYDTVSIKHYNFSGAFGNRSQGFGIGYEWYEKNDRFKFRDIWKLGWLYRPVRFFSLGLTGSFAMDGDREGYVDFGFRPLGNEKVTLFFDYGLKKGEEVKNGRWSSGVVLEELPGIRLTARYFNDRSFSIGINISFGRIGTINQVYFDNKKRHNFNTYGIRLGAYDRNLVQPLITKKKRYLELNWEGPVKYQRYKLFDKGNTLIEMLETIEIAKNDPTISGIAINTSGLLINSEMAWELREKLKDFKEKGKRVVIYLDDAELKDYHLASVADKIILDPQGSIKLTGILIGKMYYKGALDKMGIGVDEWRLFKYKSATEVLSRDRMSDADREQLTAIAEDRYNTIKKDVCTERKFTPEEFDDLINKNCYFLPKEALEKKLIDAIGRWDEIKEFIKDLEGKEKFLCSRGGLSYYQLPRDNYWGERPKIAIIYALGECAMDTGIRARSLVKDIERVTQRKDVKAVVFRVDSPGGSALASDIVTEALKKCRKKKPVIVSQGSVAGSGGYWLSMFGDKIVSSPITVTGSIGVIGLWLYNQGLKEKLGFSTDRVKVGEHADLGFGFVFPFIGQLPDRNLTEEERDKMKFSIEALYKDFLEKVSEGRNMKVEEVEKIARGRVWSGSRAKELGLIDTIGGLETAITIAREEAKIPRDEEITILELPEAKLLPPELFQPRLIGIEDNYMEFIRYLKLYAEHNGMAMPMMGIEEIMAIYNYQWH